MQPQEITTHQFANGLMLIVERMSDVQSAAFSMLVPGGSAYDADGLAGSASMLADWISRGAGDLGSRDLSSALDNLGLQHGESAGANHISFSGATVADRLPASLELLGTIIRKPHLSDEEFESVKLGAEQTLLAIEDEPQRKVMVQLRQNAFSSPWGRSPDGSLEDLERITSDSVRKHYQDNLRPNGAILGIAGNVDPQQMIKVVGEVFGDWSCGPEPGVVTGTKGQGRDSITHESSQTHIGIAWKSVALPDPDYYTAWAAVSVLSGGMSSRLFTEVREKRGLCYSVYASHTAMKQEGVVLCYAGTSNERAQETLDVTLQEICRLGDGIEDSELARCKARAKSSLVMQQESTRARAGSLSRNWFSLGRVRSLEEVHAAIDDLSVQSILDHIQRVPPQDFTVLTIGPEPLAVNLPASRG